MILLEFRLLDVKNKELAQVLVSWHISQTYRSTSRIWVDKYVYTDLTALPALHKLHQLDGVEEAIPNLNLQHAHEKKPFHAVLIGDHIAIEQEQDISSHANVNLAGHKELFDLNLHAFYEPDDLCKIFAFIFFLWLLHA